MCFSLTHSVWFSVVFGISPYNCFVCRQQCSPRKPYFPQLSMPILQKVCLRLIYRALYPRYPAGQMQHRVNPRSEDYLKNWNHWVIAQPEKPSDPSSKPKTFTKQRVQQEMQRVGIQGWKLVPFSELRRKGIWFGQRFGRDKTSPPSC